LAQPAGGGWALKIAGSSGGTARGFVDGEDSRGETPVGAGDRIEVLRSMSGG
jgi:hypothetical protein